MSPQLLIVEMLLADADARFTTGDIEGACRMIGQAALIMEQRNRPALPSVATQIGEVPAAPAVVAAEMPSALEITVDELSQMAEVVAVANHAAGETAPVVILPRGAREEERPRTMAAAA